MRRLSDLLGLDSDQRELLEAIAEEARSRFRRELVEITERQSDLEVRGFLSSTREAARAERRELDVERADLAGDVLDEMYAEFRLVLSDAQLESWELVERDRLRDASLRSGANFFAEALDPVEFVRALELEGVELDAVAPVMSGSTRALGPLLSVRERYGRAVGVAAQKVVAFIESARKDPVLFADREEMERRAASMIDDATAGAVGVYNTGIRIGELNLRTLDELRRTLGAASGAELDRLIDAFTDEYADRFDRNAPWQVRSVRRASRSERYAEQAARLESGGVPSIDPSVLAELRELAAGAASDRRPLVAEAERLFEGTGERPRDIDVLTIMGEVELELVVETDADRAEMERIVAAERQRREQLEELLVRLSEIDQRWLDRMRELLTHEQRAALAGI